MTVDPNKAFLRALTGPDGKVLSNPGDGIAVQFNPETLEVSSRSQVQENRGKDGKKPALQLVSSSERTFSVQLIFDETLTGADVQLRTDQIRLLMRPAEVTKSGYVEGSDTVLLPALVEFAWSSFAFVGNITEFSETLDYFSSSGIPLRAAVKLSISDQSGVIAASKARAAESANSSSANGSTAATGSPVPADQPLATGTDAARAGAQSASRQNGVENSRLPATDTIFQGGAAAGASVRGALGADLSGAAGAGIGIGAKFGLEASAVASGKFGLGLSAGVGVGLSIGGGFGASLGVGAGIGASAGISAGGSSAFSGGAGASVGGSADIGLGLDAFAGLKPAKAVTSAASASFGSIGASGGGASAGIGLSIGGGGGMSLGGGAKAEVGAKVNLADLLFERK